MEHSKQQNIVGAQVRRIRSQQSLSQEMLAARCGVCGWDLSRGTLAKIEAGVRCVSDGEVAFLSLALRVPVTDLYEPKLAAKLKRA